MSIHWGGRGAGHVSRRSQSATDAPSLSLNFLAGALDSRVTFTRGSNATLVDSTGKIVYAPANLLLQSQSFDDAAWTKSNATALPFDPTTATYGSNVSGTLLSSSGWTVDGCTVTTNGAGLDFAFTGTNKYAFKGITVTSGRWYRYSITLSGLAANLLWSTSGLSGNLAGASNVSGPTFTGYFFSTTSTPVFGIASFSGAGTTTISSFSVNEVIGGLITAPDGTTTADKLIEDTANITHEARQSVSVAATSHTYSAYLKAGERSFAMLFVNTLNVGTVFNLSNGTTAGNAGFSAPTAASITSVGNGWYRCSITVAATAASLSFRIYIMQNSTTYSYTGNGTSGILVWGAQLEPVTYQTAPSTYVATTASAYYGPRFDYDPVTLAPKGLLIEEARTNLMLQSQTLQTTWSRGNILAFGSGSVIDAIAAPDGTTTAEFIVPSTTGGVAHFMSQSVVHTVASYTISAYMKAGAYTKFAFRENTILGTYATFNIGTGAVIETNGTASIQNVGNGWYRCTLTYTGAAVSQIMGLYVLPAAYVSGPPHLYLWAGDGTSGLYMWGVQDELGAFATSYIPTVAASVTRSADVATMTGTNFSSWYNATQGTFVAQFTPSTISGTRAVLDANDNTANESIRLQNVSADPFFTVTDGGVDQANIDAGTVAANTSYKMAAAYTLNDFAASIGGGSVGTDASGTLPTVNQLQIGNSAAGNRLNGQIRSINYYTSRLSNAQLQTLTQ